MSTPTRFAVLIPGYNYAKGWPATLERLERWHAEAGAPALVFFADDGSIDGSGKMLAEFVARHPDWTRLVRLERNQGKGAAIRAAFAKLLEEPALPPLAVFTDCDLHYGLPIITERILPELAHNDVAIVDRSWHRSGRHASLLRQLASGLFNRSMQILTGVVLRDSQAGLKGFRVDAVRPVFDLLTLNGFAFDVEFLSIALFYRQRVRQIPVTFKTDHDFPVTSTVKIFRSSLRMLLDLVRINLNWKSGRYESEELRQRVTQTGYAIE